MRPDGTRSSAAREPVDVLSERVDTLAGWIGELETRIGAIPVASDPKALNALAKALEAWSKHEPKLERRLDERLSLLSERISSVTVTANTTASTLAGKEGDVAALRRELERVSSRLAETTASQRVSVTPSEIDELRGAVAALAERQARTHSQRDDLMPDKAEVLTERIDTLATTVATTAATLARREGELAMLRRTVDEGRAQTGSLADELHGAVRALTAQLAGLSERPADPRLSERVDELAGAVEAASGRIAERELELAAVHRELHETRSRVESVVEEAEARLAALPRPEALGDGRFLVELRGLELRVEQAEAAAREARDTVLAQLERLASGIEWRLQSLEAAAARSTVQQPETEHALGRLVPLRTEA